MTRQNSTNFTGANTFPYGTAGSDQFAKEDVQKLAAAVDNHTHASGNGLAVSSGDLAMPKAALDVAPTTAHPKDDEFNGTTLDPKWTNPATSTRTNLLAFNGDGWLMLKPSDAGSGSVSTRGGYGIRQPAPTGSFTISAKIVDSRSGDDVRAGLFVARTASNLANILGSNRNAGRIANADGISSYSESADWGGYDGYDQYTGSYVYQAYWYQIQWVASSSTLNFNYSADGFAWTLLNSRTGQAQPDRIGLAMWANSVGIYADHRLFCAWFRVTEP